MNANRIASLYGELRPLERLSLIVAASIRGDKVEANRLHHSSPRYGVWLPHLMKEMILE